jgi:hypothetical protein
MRRHARGYLFLNTLAMLIETVHAGDSSSGPALSGNTIVIGDLDRTRLLVSSKKEQEKKD